MSVAALNVVATNIHHIIECSSPESATFDILFCLLRTWSFTLFTNSAASLPTTKVLESAPSWELTFFLREREGGTNSVSKVIKNHGRPPRTRPRDDHPR